MPNNPSSFAELIERDRAKSESLQWRGPFLEYLEKVKLEPSTAKLAHARLYEAVGQDVRELEAGDDPRLNRLFGDESVKLYPFFKQEFFGVERTIGQIVRYFHSASMHG